MRDSILLVHFHAKRIADTYKLIHIRNTGRQLLNNYLRMVQPKWHCITVFKKGTYPFSLCVLL
jgi:hypothetical protein